MVKIKTLFGLREVFYFGSYFRSGSGAISTLELGQVMRTFGWSPSDLELQVKNLINTEL